MNRNKLIVIFGPTATGKTKLAARLAAKYDGEIISADSRQVYKGMNIGTGKDYADYVVNGKTIPYHLIDVNEPNEEFDLASFIQGFNAAFEKISASGKLPFLVGGTMLYIHAVLKNYKLKKVDFNSPKVAELEKLSLEELRRRLARLKPKLHNTTDLLDKKRLIKAIVVEEEKDADEISPVKTESLNLCVLPDRRTIYSRIDARFEKRLKEGMIEEAENLLRAGISFETLDFFGLEYAYLGKYLRGELNYNDMKQKLASSIKKFAKRQITWIRKMEREGIEIRYVDSQTPETAEKLIDSFLRDAES